MKDCQRLKSRDKYPCVAYPNRICPKRKPGCQDTCPEMIAAKKANNERKAIERSKRMLNNAVNEFCIERQLNAQRKKKKER